MQRPQSGRLSRLGIPRQPTTTCPGFAWGSNEGDVTRTATSPSLCTAHPPPAAALGGALSGNNNNKQPSQKTEDGDLLVLFLPSIPNISFNILCAFFSIFGVFSFYCFFNFFEKHASAGNALHPTRAGQSTHRGSKSAAHPRACVVRMRRWLQASRKL